MGKFLSNRVLQVASLTIVFTLLVPVTNVLAEDATNTSTPNVTTRRTEESSTKSSEIRDVEIRGHNFGKDKLAGDRLRFCQEVEKNLTTRSSHLSELAANMEKIFTAIAQRVENYYLTKLVPAGKTLPNYDALVADITTKQDAIAPLIDAANKDFRGFTCGSDNPKAQLTQFRVDMQAVKDALHNYRTSIKNLIVAIRTLGDVEPSASPTATSSSTLSR